MLFLIYSVLFTLLLPLPFIRLWFKGKKNPGYRVNWPERLGALPFKLDESIWIHGVSLGEMVAAAPLIQTLLDRNPRQKIVLSCMTPTGRLEADKWANQYKDRVFATYLPYDAPFCIKRAIAAIKPSLLIVMETEIWPNLFRLVKAPIIIANARISDHANPGYQRFRFAIKPCFRYVSEVAAQSEIDAQRFKALGAKNVSVMGNIKYDLASPIDAIEKALKLQKAWPERLIITAGSTHEGEESLLLEAYKKLKPQFPDLLLILVPRHPERFDRVEAIVKEMQLKSLRRSSGRALTDEDIFIVDTVGEVKTFYALSDLVFVGGSLIPIGGHNILEAAILGKAIVVGPHMQNARKIVQEFLSHQALTQLQSSSLNELTCTLQNLLSDSTLRTKLGNNALQMMDKNKGALNRLLKIVDNDKNI